MARETTRPQPVDSAQSRSRLPHTSHADQLVETARDVFGRGDSFVAKITGSPTVDRPLQRIREFRNRPQPGIVVTVDMLSTGVRTQFRALTSGIAGFETGRKDQCVARAVATLGGGSAAEKAG